jgi:hypothetical protein
MTTTGLNARGIRVGLTDLTAVRQPQRELVISPLVQARNKQLPDATGGPVRHHMLLRVPVVEVPHHRHRLGIRGPDGKRHVQHAVLRARGGAQFFPRL